ncbi:chloride channel protein [Melioribacter sp. Ez-97]|uniref:chloride channel protein n=1 Tax=Melioribacter sp. Ez-97 TaxID=3423434 RepID=UPI003ED8D1AD
MKKFYRRLSDAMLSLLERAKMTEYTFILIIAIIIGLLAGFSAIGIRWLIKTITAISFGSGSNLLDVLSATPWYLLIIIPALGGLIVGPIIYYLAPEAKGHGVPEVMQAILLKGGIIRPRVALIKSIASAITIGTGGSVGREGPIIQIGSSIGSTIGQFFKAPSRRLKTLVGCGAAAGIAAAFNAPIAGALFAVEIILMDFAIVQFSPIVISSVMATVVSHTFEGDFAAFIVPHYHYASPYEIGFYFLLGAVCGLFSYLFIKLLYFSENFFDNKLKLPEQIKPALGGIIIGIIALQFPHVMGVGYDTINLALHGNLIWYLAIGLLFAKIVATSVTLGSGGSGGIFAPSLFMGAMIGVFFGEMVHGYFPEITAEPGAYALVAMGGLVAGTTRAPITAIIIVFELTNDYKIILPLMITCIISMILSTKLSRESIYTLKLVMRNIGIKEGREINIMESILIKDVYNKPDPKSVIFIEDKFGTIVNKLIHNRGREFPVVDANGVLQGIISVDMIKDFLFEKDSLSSVLIAADIMNRKFEYVTPEDNCSAAIDRMRKYDHESIPVIENADSMKLAGIVSLKDIQDAYNLEIEKREITSSLSSSIMMNEKEQRVHFLEGYEIMEITAPESFYDKSIRELNVRAEYGVDILSIKKSNGDNERVIPFPSPDYVIRKEDRLVVAGEIKNINLLSNI